MPLEYKLVAGSEPLLLFIHGLGADGRCFAGALEAPELRGRALLIPDLVGFGDSHAADGFSFCMADQAAELRQLCEGIGAGTLAIVAHSMGGAVGILLAESLPGRVTHFANAVGNLIPEDCFFSRKVAAMSFETFAGLGFDAFKAGIASAATSKTRPASTYVSALERTSARAMYESSKDLVRLCDQEQLLDRFVRLPCAKRYLHDQDNPVAAPLQRALLESGIPTSCIADTGHALMEENPAAFYGEVARFLGRSTLRAW
jgi:pimeloyl-ACP methyl ester carboxylesterase